jgi:hypothetical protein
MCLIRAKWSFGIARLALLLVVLVPAITSQAKAAAPQAVRAACHDDVRRLCAAVLWNAEARQACMREHSAELSAGCKAAIAQWHGREGGTPQVGQLQGGGGCMDFCRTLPPAPAHNCVATCQSKHKFKQ